MSMVSAGAADIQKSNLIVSSGVRLIIGLFTLGD